MSRWSPSKPSVTADIIALKAMPPLFGQGRVDFEGPSTCTVETPSDTSALKSGMDILIDASREAGCRLIGQVDKVAPGHLRVRILKVVPTDQRIYPRMWGGIDLRYIPLPKGTPEATLKEWLAGGPLEGTWYHPEPFMDFSASGLRFEHRATCAKDDIVLVEFRLPFRGETLRATSVVVRVAPLTAEELEEQDPTLEAPATHEIAIQFCEMGPGAIEALMDFTRRLQEVFV